MKKKICSIKVLSIYLKSIQGFYIIEWNQHPRRYTLLSRYVYV